MKIPLFSSKYLGKKTKVILLIILSLLLVGAGIIAVLIKTGKLGSKAESVSNPLSASRLYPSVRLADYIVGDQTAIDWLATHDDFIVSAPSPIDNWYSRAEYNPNLAAGKYFELTILNLIEDPSGDGTGSSHQAETMRWYKDSVSAGTDWEDGFLHLGNQDTYRTQALGGYGDRYDAKVRYVFKNTSTTNNKDAAWNGTASLGLATASDALYFGRLDRFDELNLEYSIAASNAWNGIWEYWNGSSWVSLTLSSDTTNDSQQNGQIKFVPPTASQWQRTKVNAQPAQWGDQGVYFIRLRPQTVASPAPVIKKAQGRHYWVHNGTLGNTIPAWDPANDGNGDGYVEASEVRNGAATAKFKYESRIPNFWAWCQFNVNVKNTSITSKYVNYALDLLNSSNGTNHRYNGAYLDNMNGATNIPNEIKNTGRTIEYPGLSGDALVTDWQNDVERNILIPAKTVLHNNNYLIGGNAGYKGIAQFSQHFDFHMREGGNSFLPAANASCGSPNWGEHILPAGSTPDWMLRSDQGKFMVWQWQLSHYYNVAKSLGEYADATKATIADVNGTQIIGSRTHWTQTVDPAGSIFLMKGKVAEVDRVVSNTEIILKTDTFTDADIEAFNFIIPRDKMAGLAAFMTIQKPDTDYLQLWQGFNYHGSKSKYENWIPAITLDYGVPTGVVPVGKEARGTRGSYVIQTGDDPTSSSPYVMFARDYTKALTIYRPPSCSSGFLDSSAVTVTLPEPMKVVDYSGNISATAVTQVVLRNNEGVILMKGTTSPPPSDPLTVNAGSDQTTGTQFTQNATTTGATSFQWSQTSGSGAITFGSATAEDTTVSASADGSYTIRLTVTGSTGNTASDEFVLNWSTATPPPPPPPPTFSVNAGIDQTASTQFTQDATVVGAVSVRWSKVSGSGNITFGSPTSEDTTISASKQGNYIIRLTATDASGNTKYDEFNLRWRRR